MSNGLQFTTWSFLEFFECPIYSVKFLVVYYTSLDSRREDAGYFTLTESRLFFIIICKKRIRAVFAALMFNVSIHSAVESIHQQSISINDIKILIRSIT